MKPYIVTIYSEGSSSAWRRLDFRTMRAALECVAKNIRDGSEVRVFKAMSAPYRRKK